MGNFNLGTARGIIQLDYRGGAAIQQAGRDIAGLGKASGSAHPLLGKLALAAGGAVVGGLALAIKSAASFEKGLSGIQAVSGASASEMEKVRAKALQLGADTAFSAQDAASAIEELVKAGIPIAGVMGGAADATVALAAAGGIDLPTAATIAANAMNQFGLSAQEMPKIADKIAGAANASAIDVGDFGMSMSQAGAVAHLAGLSFDDTALAITAMGNAGIKGSDAGTSLKTFLQNLQPTTKKQTELMKELGIVTEDGANRFFDASGKIKSMSDIAGVLGGALKGMSDKQKTATLETLFGSDAIRAAAVIAGQGSKGMDKLSTSINKIKAADVAKTRMDNLAGSVEQLKGSAETAMITLGSTMTPIMRTIVDALTGVINTVVANFPQIVAQFKDWWSALTPIGTALKNLATFIKDNADILKFLAVTILAGIAAWKTYMAIVNAVKAIQAAYIAVQLAVNAAMMANPIGIIIALIVALVAAILYLWNNNEGFRNAVIAIWNAIKGAVAAVVNWFTTTLPAAFSAVWNAIKTGLAAIGAFFTSIWNAIKSVVSTVWNAIYTVVATYINLVRTVITTVLNVLLSIWNGVWNLFGPLVKAVWGLIVAIVTLAIKLVMFVVRGVLMVIKAIWTSVWNAIKAVATTVWNAIKSVITSVINAIRSVVTSVFNAIRSFVTSVWNGIKSVTTTVWNAIKAAVTGPINAARAVVQSVGQAIDRAISTSFNAAKTAAINAFNAMKSGVSNIINSVKTIIGNVVGSIKGIFAGAGGWLIGAGKAIVQGLIDGIVSLINAVKEKLSFLTNLIPDWKGPKEKDAKLLRDNGALIIQSLIDGFVSKFGAVERTLGGLTDDIPTAVNANVTQVSGLSPAASAVSASAPAMTAAGDTNYITVQIDPSDLAGLVEVERFVAGIRQKARMREGVRN